MLRRPGCATLPTSHRQLPFLVCPAPDRGRFAMPGDHAHALVEPLDDVALVAALQESDAVVAAGRQDAVARRLHFRWIGLGWNRAVAERKTQVAAADFGKAQPRDREDFLAIGDALGAFQFYAQQQFAVRIE